MLYIAQLIQYCTVIYWEIIKVTTDDYKYDMKISLSNNKIKDLYRNTVTLYRIIEENDWVKIEYMHFILLINYAHNI